MTLNPSPERRVLARRVEPFEPSVGAALARPARHESRARRSAGLRARRSRRRRARREPVGDDRVCARPSALERVPGPAVRTAESSALVGVVEEQDRRVLQEGASERTRGARCPKRRPPADPTRMVVAVGQGGEKSCPPRPSPPRRSRRPSRGAARRRCWRGSVSSNSPPVSCETTEIAPRGSRARGRAV